MPCHRVQDRHYGWIIVAALSVTETISWGILYYGFPVFLRAMEADLRASTVAVTGALSLALGVAALAALPVGRWIDHRGPRALMTAGSGLGKGRQSKCWRIRRSTSPLARRSRRRFKSDRTAMSFS